MFNVRFRPRHDVPSVLTSEFRLPISVFSPPSPGLHPLSDPHSTFSVQCSTFARRGWVQRSLSASLRRVLRPPPSFFSPPASVFSPSASVLPLPLRSRSTPPAHAPRPPLLWPCTRNPPVLSPARTRPLAWPRIQPDPVCPDRSRRRL